MACLDLHWRQIDAPLACTAGARLGVLSGSDDVDVQTPAYLLSTRRGLVPHLVPDLVRRGAASLHPLIELRLGDFASDSNRPEVALQGVLAAWPRAIVYVSGRSNTSTGQLDVRFATPSATTAALETTSGTRKVSPQAWAELQAAIGGSFFAEPGPELACTSKAGPVAVHSRRLQVLAEGADAALPAALRPRMWPVVCAGRNGYAAAAQSALSRSPTAPGVIIGGLSSGESIKELENCVRDCTSALPPDRMRLVACSGAPAEVVAAVQAGADLLTGPYPFVLAACGLAEVFDLRACSASTRPRALLDLRDRGKGDDDDDLPLRLGCGCTVCSSVGQDGPAVTRGYLRHLWAVREMNAKVLLAEHNLFWYLELFSELRARIAKGSLDEFAAALRVDSGACARQIVAARPH